MDDGYGFCPYCECDSSEEVSMGDLFLTHHLVRCKKCYRLFIKSGGPAKDTAIMQKISDGCYLNPGNCFCGSGASETSYKEDDTWEINFACVTCCNEAHPVISEDRCVARLLALGNWIYKVEMNI